MPDKVLAVRSAGFQPRRTLRLAPAFWRWRTHAVFPNLNRHVLYLVSDDWARASEPSPRGPLLAFRIWFTSSRAASRRCHEHQRRSFFRPREPESCPAGGRFPPKQITLPLWCFFTRARSRDPGRRALRRLSLNLPKVGSSSVLNSAPKLFALGPFLAVSRHRSVAIQLESFVLKFV